MTHTEQALSTQDLLVCNGCNVAISTGADTAEQRAEAQSTHDDECWSHGSTSWIDGETYRSCVHPDDCYRTVVTEGAAL